MDYAEGRAERLAQLSNTMQKTGSVASLFAVSILFLGSMLWFVLGGAE
jgi:hypothetical protein